MALNGKSLVKVSTERLSICVFWTRKCMVKPHYSNFRIIIAIFGSPNFLDF